MGTYYPKEIRMQQTKSLLFLERDTSRLSVQLTSPPLPSRLGIHAGTDTKTQILLNPHKNDKVNAMMTITCMLENQGQKQKETSRRS